MTDPQGYGGTWYAATMVPAPERERLTFDLDVDVCVIGGGLAGLTTAREIARRNWSVAVLEAQRIAWSASGRNDGFVLPGFADDIDRIVARVGLDHAKELWNLSAAGVEYVRHHISEAKLPGVDPTPGWLAVSKSDRRNALTRRAALLQDELATPVELWPVERVRAVLKSESYFDALYFPRAFHIHPLNYALGLANVAEAAGVRIFEQTPALAIDASGVRKRVTTPRALLRADHVVLAANTHLGGLMPRLAQTILPISTYVATTGPLLADIGAVATQAAVSDSPWADSHYRVVGGDRLLWSGRVTTWNADPRRYIKALRADIARIYPQLGNVAIEYIWSGTLGRSVHSMPQLGELSPGLWVASAFGGHGLNTTAMAGCLLARAITEGDQTLRLFAPYELVWAGGPLGRAAAQVFYWGTRIHERARGLLARRREQARRARHAGPDTPRRIAHPPSVAPMDMATEPQPAAAKARPGRPGGKGGAGAPGRPGKLAPRKPKQPRPRPQDAVGPTEGGPDNPPAPHGEPDGTQSARARV
jgi:glycine/D-amino acid oxidase-like deaminating enzyme